MGFFVKINEARSEAVMKLTLIMVLLSILFSAPSEAAPWTRTQPVYEVSNVPVITYSDKEIMQASVGKEIVRALTKKRWAVTKEDKATGILQAEILVRRHYAKIEIKYSATNYSITYMDSRDLRYRNGEIHRNYNKWIKLLDEAIRQNLMHLY
jgi:hypothetical protein